jgi:hypothetical protein
MINKRTASKMAKKIIGRRSATAIIKTTKSFGWIWVVLLAEVTFCTTFLLGMALEFQTKWHNITWFMVKFGLGCLSVFVAIAFVDMVIYNIKRQ